MLNFGLGSLNTLFPEILFTTTIPLLPLFFWLIQLQCYFFFQGDIPQFLSVGLAALSYTLWSGFNDAPTNVHI